jgi:hypothetical protein
MPSATQTVDISMKIANTTMVPALTVALAMLASQPVDAEEYRLVAADSATSCQSGTRTDGSLDGPDEVKIARADRDTVNAAVCVAEGSKSGVHVRWKANGYWKSSGTVSDGCAEILGASKIAVRPVNTNFHESATYYSCIQ